MILGITFKENCPDYRNTKVIDLIKDISELGFKPFLFDPLVNKNEIKKNHNIDMVDKIPNQKFDGIIIAVAHDEFVNLNFDKLSHDKTVILDVKGILKNKNNPNIYRL